MATGILGMGSSGSTGLSQELIDKLKAAEKKARVDPIEARITKITSLEDGEEGEQYKLEVIKTKVADFLDKVKQFDLFNADNSVFDQISASSSGTSVTFSADDAKLLPQGITKVNVTELAQKDVFQSSEISSKTALLGNGTITISLNKGTVATDDDTVYNFVTDGKTYEAITQEIENKTGIKASLEQIGDSNYRLIIKSEDSGTKNSFSVNSTVSGFSFSQTLSAQNMKATVDGVNYELSSNQFTVNNGLKINAIAIGESSITISKNTDQIVPSVEALVQGYNDLMQTINDELYNAETPMENLASLKMMVGDIKSYIFNEYGTNNDLNIFSYGFSLDTNGYMSLDTKVFAEALSKNPDDLKTLFVGVAEKKGLGTGLKEYLDGLNYNSGILNLYEDDMIARKTKLEDEKTKAQDTLDAKYNLLAQQFAQYTAIISQMENSFGGLKMLIQQSTASN